MKLTVVSIFLLIFITSSNSSFYSLPLKLLKFTANKIINNPNIDSECASDLKSLLSDSYQLKLWALQMLDASGKFNAGVLGGNFQLLGNYDQCLAIEENVHGRTITGQYCTVLLVIKDQVLGSMESTLKLKNMISTDLFKGGAVPGLIAQNITVPLGICIPKSCSINNLGVLSSLIQRAFKLPGRAVLAQDLCAYKDKPRTTRQLDIFIYCFFLTYLVIMLASTLYDVYLRCSDQDSDIFVIFSAYTNMKKLLSAPPTKHDCLSCLSGIKVLSSAWIFLSHMMLMSMLVTKNLAYVFTEWKNQVHNTFFTSAFYGVDTFFSVSGLLMTYLYLTYSEKVRVNLISFYLVRFIRLMPTLLATIFIQISILKLFIDGPYGAYVVKVATEQCYDNWWASLFFLQNFLDFNHQCAHHTWYITVDTHLYLCAPLILFFLKKYPRKVIGGMVIAFLTCVIYSSVVTIVKRLGFTLYEINNDYIDYLYLSSLYHMPSWLIGVLFGYLLYKHSKNMKIHKTVNMPLWVTSLYTMLKLILNQIVFVQEEYDVYRSALWNGLARPTWSLAVCFIIFSCGTGHGGVVNAFLSHYVFRVLGKLTYCMYLMHLGVIIILVGNSRETFYFNNFQSLCKFCGVFVIVLMCSTFLYLGFEAPIVALKNREKKMESINVS